MKKEQIVKPFLFNILTLDSDGFMRLQAFEVHSFNNLLIAYQSLNSSLLETLVCSLGNIWLTLFMISIRLHPKFAHWKVLGFVII